MLVTAQTMPAGVCTEVSVRVCALCVRVRHRCESKPVDRGAIP